MRTNDKSRKHDQERTLFIGLLFGLKIIVLQNMMHHINFNNKSLTKLTPSIQYMIKLYFDAKTYSFYQQIRKEKSIRGNQAVKRIHDPQLKKVIYLVIIMLMPKLFLQKPSKKLNAKKHKFALEHHL